MLRNYWITAIRNIQRNKLHTVINMVGLTIGFACFILISLWIKDEYSYDKSLHNKERIFQLTLTHPTHIKDSNVPNILPVLLAIDYSEIQNYTRTVRLSNKITCSFRIQDNSGLYKTFIEENVILVDTGFFSIFPYPILQGEKQNLFKESNSLVLSKQVAKQFFGDDIPVGKRIVFNNTEEYIVTGVFEQRGKSHLKLDILMPIPTHHYDNWTWADPSYILTSKDINVDNFREKIVDFFNFHQPYNLQGNFILDILPITSSYLGFGRMKYIYIFSTVAFLALLIGGINYVNLYCAGLSSRLKEMMVRKNAGARKFQLITQIISECVLLSLLALILSIILVELILSSFNVFFDKSLQFDMSFLKLLIFLIFPVAIIFGILTGLFPALFLAGRKISNKYKSTLSISRFRNYSVIGQFAISVILISFSIFIIRQLQYIKESPLGFDPSYVIKMPMSPDLEIKFDVLKEELLKNPRILNVSAGQAVPFNEDYKTSGIFWQGKDPDFVPMFRYTITTQGFIETFGMKITEGRNFLEGYAPDRENYLVNEEAVQYMGLKDPIGKKINFWDQPGEIIGIIKDFHHVSLHREILPQIISINPSFYSSIKYIFVKISSNNVNETLHFLHSTTKKIAPNFTFDFSFIDEEIDELYLAEKRFGKLIVYFTIITMIICALGVYGITAFFGEQRSKEIGIRKVYGASNLSIITLFNKKILRWIILASIISFPISYIISIIWLRNFAYQTQIAWWAILLASFIAVLIGLLTSSVETLKAAVRNPVKSLRYE